MPDLAKLVVMLFVVACAEPGAASGSGAAPDPGLAFETGESGQVTEITGPLSLVVETGDAALEVRLAGLDRPGSASAADAGNPGQQEQVLAEMLGQAVRLAYDGQRRDRYDRALAQVYRVEDGVWLQAALVSAGQARVLSHKSNRQAARALLMLEADARAAGAGLWADPANAVRDTHPDALAQDVGSVQLVEGRVMEVTRLRSGRTYINFGLDYRTDFTLVVEAADEAAFEAAGRRLADLAGHRIRVRGWIEAENGPLIRLDHPERIEWLDG